MQFFQIIVSTLKAIDVWAVIDILVVSYIFYKAYMLIKDTRAEQLLKGILLILLLFPITYELHLRTLYWILNKTMVIGLITFVIIFQPEIRRALEHLGRTAFVDKHILEDDETMNKVVNQVVIAASNLSETKTGALIIIEQRTGLLEIMNTGTRLDAIVSSALLENIFVVNTPLHDGATIIRNDRIAASGCFLPLTSNNELNKKLGTRHRAGIGISEVSDAVVIIVSEETGTISLAINGKLTRGYDRDSLRDIITKIIKHKQTKKVGIKEKVNKWFQRRKNN